MVKLFKKCVVFLSRSSGGDHMLTKQIHITTRPARPLPISYIVLVAQQCPCEVYIRQTGIQINAKDYDQMMRDWSPRGERLVFYLNGADEAAAGDRLQKALEV